MFWEKSDFDDSDLYSAFRKRQKEKMKLRKKAKYELESYIKMFELRRESVAVLKILMQVWQREDIKKRFYQCDQKSFELQYDAFLRDKGISLSYKIPQKIDIDKL